MNETKTITRTDCIGELLFDNTKIAANYARNWGITDYTIVPVSEFDQPTRFGLVAA